MKFLVLQHIAVEHPGSFREFMAADGVAWDTVELDAGEPIPPLDGYGAVLSMGGPMEVFEEAAHPWLAAEKALIRDAVGREVPFLGFCLGHQLLADALGGTVGRMAAPEVGILEVELTAAGADDALLRGLDATIPCLQWHGSAVEALPAGGSTLMRSAACAVQAFRAGPRAYGVQFHVELTASTIADWAAVPAYRASLEASFGAGGVARLETDAARHMAAFGRAARTLYDNFRALVAR